MQSPPCTLCPLTATLGDGDDREQIEQETEVFFCCRLWIMALLLRHFVIAVPNATVTVTDGGNPIFRWCLVEVEVTGS